MVSAAVDKEQVKAFVREEMSKVTDLIADSTRKLDEGNTQVKETQYKLDETIVRLEEYTDKKIKELEVDLRDRLAKAKEEMHLDAV